MVDKKEDKIEREYVIPLRHRWQIVPRYQRTNKAVRTVKEFLVRHMKIRDRDLDKIRIEKSLNELIWMRGIKNPPSKVKVKAIREGDIVRVEGAELPERLKFKKLREEKLESSAKEVAKKKKTEKVSDEKVDEVKREEVSEEKQKEVEEKKEAVVEVGKEMEKTMAKKEKHTTKVKSPKQEKNLQTDYNKSGRGH
ncbi:MAG: 50S ribosomal protein L31e [Candidatus Nanoarchaeia archaeon]|nr:50S ribosomal protein L31e [Candidatus Nanoarchaeia archaeon]MDD5357601.1 50S ribosomal protein L31e [Candidatus Nanoarchaeia archaeon]MDD5588520.1 50S ribosomal protein L31e [Candidatus Nanoarchaeia archaeon]